jgi:hypothetical protein
MRNERGRKVVGAGAKKGKRKELGRGLESKEEGRK